MRRLFLMIILLGSALGGWAQYESKYSNSTQMFLSERRGDVQLPNSKTKVSRTMVPMLPVGASDLAKMRTQATRPIAEVELVDSKEMISAFIGLSDNNFAAIEALGAVVQSKFDKLVAALIPVDKIEEVAALDNVTKIEVAEVLKVSNDRQRQATQAGDAIVNSAMAQALGLTKQYTGKGVVLGIVDTGIDFQHIAFKDKSGKSRIVRAYKLSGSTSTSLTTYSTATDIAKLTYDTNLEDHGTHTSSTAGGSSVIVNGNNVTVTDGHANATSGGMAPEAVLVVAGPTSLYTTSMCDKSQSRFSGRTARRHGLLSQHRKPMCRQQPYHRLCLVERCHALRLFQEHRRHLERRWLLCRRIIVEEQAHDGQPAALLG